MGRLSAAAALAALPVLARAGLEAYSESEALDFLQLARVSFCDNTTIVKWRCGDACKSTRQLVDGRAQLIGPGTVAAVQGYAVRLAGPGPLGEKRCALAYRGSVNVDNWEADAKIVMTSWPLSRLENGEEEAHVVTRDYALPDWCPGCKVHLGFAEAYGELSNSTYTVIRNLGCELLDVTGHSLGAAIATLAAAELRGLGVQVRMLWTYGSPRVGNLAFAKAFMALAEKQKAPVASWRVVHYHDPVPQGGPSTFYTHIPHQVYYERDSSRYEVCPLGNLSVNGGLHPSCGMNLLSTADILGGLHYNDHVTYMNKTLALKDMDEQCVYLNFCNNHSSLYTLWEMAAACLVSAVLGATVTPFAWRRISSRRKGDDDSEEDEGESSSGADGL